MNKRGSDGEGGGEINRGYGGDCKYYSDQSVKGENLLRERESRVKDEANIYLQS